MDDRSGPEGGINGGYLIAEGAPTDISRDGASITGSYLISYGKEER